MNLAALYLSAIMGLIWYMRLAPLIKYTVNLDQRQLKKPYEAQKATRS